MTPAVAHPPPVGPAPPPKAPPGRPLDHAQQPRDEAPSGPGSPDRTAGTATPSEGAAGRVRIVLEDGTLAKPDLDPEAQERLRYIVDNLVRPSEPS